MKVVLSTIRRDHIFDLARQLHEHDMLSAIFSGYPMFRLRDERLPPELIKSFPWLQTVYMARGRFGLNSLKLQHELEWWSHKTLDAYSAQHLPECDIFYGFAGCGLATGRRAQRQGAAYVCDRPNSHIRFQDEFLQEEYDRHGIVYERIEQRIIAKEEQEYATADLIVVPSNFARRTFLNMGFSEDKVKCVSFGADLSRFHPVNKPDKTRFDVLFVGSQSIRKGIPYLLRAFEQINHPAKHLTIVGPPQPETQDMVARFASRLPITCTGASPQSKLKEIMSRSHVMVLPSVEEGLALVQAEALACGCPVIGTTNSGAEDLLQDGKEGYIVPIRDPDAIAERLQRLADDPDLQQAMAFAALERVKMLGGWSAYGDSMVNHFSKLIGHAVA